MVRGDIPGMTDKLLTRIWVAAIMVTAVTLLYGAAFILLG